MATKPTRQRRARGSIDPEMVIDGAFEVAERDGIDGLSMPVLAAHLDVGVTSIYWYFQSKEGLLRQMSARALKRSLELAPKPEGRDPHDWRAFLHEMFTASRAISAEDSLVTEFTIMRTATFSMRTTHDAFANLESTLEYLVAAGFRVRSAWMVWSTLSLYTRGFVLAEHNRHNYQVPPVGLAQLGLLNQETMPLLTELVSEEPEIILDGTGDPGFQFGLDALLDVAERVLAEDLATPS